MDSAGKTMAGGYGETGEEEEMSVMAATPVFSGPNSPHSLSLRGGPVLR